MVRTFISLPAGIARMRFIPFVIWTFVGSLPWCYALAWAACKLGDNWTALEPWFRRFDVLIGAVIVAGRRDLGQTSPQGDPEDCPSAELGTGDRTRNGRPTRLSHHFLRRVSSHELLSLH